MFFTDVGIFYRDRQLKPHQLGSGHYFTDQSSILSTNFMSGDLSRPTWNELLHEYSGRELSFDHDILQAVSGILHRHFG